MYSHDKYWWQPKTVKPIIEWLDMDKAPRDGTPIIGNYGGDECGIFWSDNPVCILGPRNGSFPEGWATDGTDTDYNLPMDEPESWKEYTNTPTKEV
jgi:hypothetical protein